MRHVPVYPPKQMSSLWETLMPTPSQPLAPSPMILSPSLTESPTHMILPPEPPLTADPWITMAPSSYNYAQTVTTLSLMAAPPVIPKATIHMNAAPSGVSLIMASSPHPYGHMSETSKWASTTPSYPTTPLSYPNLTSTQL